MQSLMQNMENASPEQRTEVLERLEEMQLKDTLRMFNGLVERCFSECVTGFRSKSLTGPEEKCVTVCANKYLKHSGRVGQRFHELSSQQQEPAPGGGGT